MLLDATGSHGVGGSVAIPFVGYREDDCRILRMYLVFVSLPPLTSIVCGNVTAIVTDGIFANRDNFVSFAACDTYIITIEFPPFTTQWELTKYSFQPRRVDPIPLSPHHAAKLAGSLLCCNRTCFVGMYDYIILALVDGVVGDLREIQLPHFCAGWACDDVRELLHVICSGRNTISTLRASGDFAVLRTVRLNDGSNYPTWTMNPGFGVVSCDGNWAYFLLHCMDTGETLLAVEVAATRPCCTYKLEFPREKDTSHLRPGIRRAGPLAVQPARLESSATETSGSPQPCLRLNLITSRLNSPTTVLHIVQPSTGVVHVVSHHPTVGMVSCPQKTWPCVNATWRPQILQLTHNRGRVYAVDKHGIVSECALIEDESEQTASIHGSRLSSVLVSQVDALLGHCESTRARGVCKRKHIAGQGIRYGWQFGAGRTGIFSS